MRSLKLTTALGLVIAATSLAACNQGSDLAGSGEDTGPPGGPGSAPPTGGKWEGRETTDECGRSTIEWFVIDEVCGATDDPAYLENFRAPIMRDGATLGDRLYTVDATHLWVLDISTPSSPVRTALVSGFGQPLATATHEGRLILAAGAEGLLVVDVTDPDAPRREATVALGASGASSPALDVFIDGDLAYVAAGAGGIVVVDLSGTPRVVRTLEVSGFVAGVAVAGGVAFAAACETVVTLDAETGEELGNAWLEDAYDENGTLVAPAKDVLLDGNQLYVAAGRYGAVRMDVSSPSAPEVVGNCTLVDQLGFYASGLRSQGDRLYVAGGEWGILPLALDAGECTSLVTPELISSLGGGQPEEEGEECSTEPPWETLPWEETWLPPVQPNQDPLQTLPVGEVLYAFGDATRIGMRAVDVRLAEAENLDAIGRYEEPRRASAIAAHGTRVLVVGREGGLFDREGDELVRAEVDLPEAREAIDGAFLDDGRWVLALAEPRRVSFEAGTTSVLGAPDEVVWPGTLGTSGNQAVLTDGAGATLVDADGGGPRVLFSGRNAELPASVAAFGGTFVVASPEWTEAVALGENGVGEPLAPHGIFGEQDAASVTEWRVGLPRRLLQATPTGILELATLGRRAGVALHVGSANPVPVELPPGEYVDLTSDGQRAYAVSLDRGTYRSQLVTLDLAGGAPRIVAVDAWTGMAAGVAATAEGIFVADRDRGVRIYDATPDGASLAGVTSLGVTP